MQIKAIELADRLVPLSLESDVPRTVKVVQRPKNAKNGQKSMFFGPRSSQSNLIKKQNNFPTGLVQAQSFDTKHTTE